MSETTRIAAHVRAEQAARVGYDYPDRAVEGTWVREHLPTTRRQFLAVVEAVRATGWAAGEAEVAVLLLGIGRLSLPDSSVADAWLRKPRTPGTRTARSCYHCGAPATSRANFGWACEAHYDC